MEIQELTKSPPETFFSFIHIANKSKLKFTSQYSTNNDYKKILENILRTKPPQIPNFHDIYDMIKAFSVKVKHFSLQINKL